jgi:hypothetical protein
MKTPTVFLSLLCVSLSSLAAHAAEGAPSPDQAAAANQATTSLLEYTLAYRLEEANALEQAGKFDDAAAAYNALLALCDTTDGMAAQAWLKAAAFKARHGERVQAQEMWCSVPTRFGRLPWAQVEAREHVALEKMDCGAPIAAAQPRTNNGDRLITLDLNEASLAKVGDIFRDVMGTRLDIDPALADRRVTVKLSSVPARDALAQISAQVGAHTEAVAGGLRVVANANAAPTGRTPSSREVEMVGSLDKEQIRGVVRAHVEQVQACYEAALAAHPDSKGKVVVSWTISPSGSVTQVASTQKGGISEDTQVCVRTAVQGWTFPQPRGGGNVKVTYPFVFAQSR